MNQFGEIKFQDEVTPAYAEGIYDNRKFILIANDEETIIEGHFTDEAPFALLFHIQKHPPTNTIVLIGPLCRVYTTFPMSHSSKKSKIFVSIHPPRVYRPPTMYSRQLRRG